MYRLWIGAFFTAVTITVATGIAWLTLGARWALGIAVVLLAAWVGHHLVHLSRLERWLRRPESPAPSGTGHWDEMYALLFRRERVQQQRITTLEASLERMREASQAMPDGTVVLTADDTIEWINATAARHLDINADTDCGMSILNLVRQPDFAAYLRDGNYGVPLLLRLIRQPATTLQVQVVRFAEDRRLLLTRDVSQQERLDTMRRDFVANVSHELKTPLTVVSGFLETLDDALPDLDLDTARHYIGLAHEQAGRMQRLVDDLLTLAALDTGSPLPDEEAIPLRAMLESVRAEMEALSAGRHQIVLHLEGVDWLYGCAKELRSVFANLVSNAVRYTPAGGHVTIAWRGGADGGEFSVQDDGIGIAPEHLPRLTERFYRVDRGRSRETGGTGLGLAIVKHVLERHQANLSIQSEIGKGSRFTVRFPARRLVAERNLRAV